LPYYGAKFKLTDEKLKRYENSREFHSILEQIPEIGYERRTVCLLKTNELAGRPTRKLSSFLGITTNWEGLQGNI